MITPVRKMRGLQYIGARLQYIEAPKFYFQESGKEGGERVLIKPGFVCHMMVYQLNWKAFVCRVSCSKIKQKTCFLKRRGFNILGPTLQYMEPGPQYIGTHQIFVFYNHTSDILEPLLIKNTYLFYFRT